ncbi:23S rRNA (adenine(2503)-C(2))-methyltransferase RlmN [Butyrivibrio sp. LC3010]|uniref:23S rRNA (adenine(2503)-C(2))-methyltransferase RlmN n=1 Tax=Butyrivibrio sp. LC3010 TaxID=1280680 RepID=UPI0004059E99|nr:23S rRNA (adenine(2503)-C(2))-methyltransferase RlmN [Butyrivibrio sp. LC3010]
MTDIKSLTKEELTDFIKDMGEPGFRAGQIYDWMHKKQAAGFDEMTNLSKGLRDKLSKECEYVSLKIERVQESRIDGTRKYLFELADGNLIESVFMKYRFGNSVCVSSQVGCRMGCRFCASTIDGVERNLRPSEILDQIYAIMRDTGEKVSRVVVMGSGEPLDNYDNVIRFVKLLTDENGYNLGQRNLTISTCGIVPNMKRLAEEKLQINLAISLHASNQTKRQELMPIANKYSIEELLDACRDYFDKTGRQLTFEYSLVGGVNDTDADADELAGLLKDLNCVVNLIPVNPIKERDYVESTAERVQAFKRMLEKRHINATIRREMGRDIDGACGQLRRRHISEKKGYCSDSSAHLLR